MSRFLVILALALAVFPAYAVVVEEEIEIQSNYVKLGAHPAEGGVLESFSLLASPDNLAGPGGLLEEGFGLYSPYLPNRRLNIKMEVLDEFTDRPVLQYSYDCDGPNISGLHVTRRMELYPEESSVRVTWTVENRGTERHWVAPWVRCDVSAGVATDAQDRMEFMSLSGKVSEPGRRYYPAARNWAAVTDPNEQRTCYAVFNADHLHSILSFRGDDAECAFQAHFVPVVLQPGKTWETKYRLNAVSGLTRVDYATDEMALQLDASEGKLKALMSSATALPELEIHASVLAANSRVWKLEPKKFDILPGKLVRATFDWSPPSDGTYEFLAQLQLSGKEAALGKDTASPHGGIDTQFVVGKADKVKFEPWTSAPFALDQQPRALERTLLADGPVRIWREPSMNKVQQGDVPDPQGTPNPEVSLRLAKGEAESFQIAFRAQPGEEIFDISINAGTLEGDAGTLPAEAVQLRSVDYVDSRIPSHYEGVTGALPDILRPLQPFAALANRTVPVWVTVSAAPETPAGIYKGTIQIAATGLDPIEVFLAVEVFDFALPDRPSLKTDFGLDLEAALQAHRKAGGSLTREQLAQRFAQTALSHRITLRGLTQLPAPANDYAGALGKFEKQLGPELMKHATTFSVPPQLSAYPDMMKRAALWLETKKLATRSFVQVADEPAEPAWTKVLEQIALWKTNAPAIAPRVSATGLRPFLPIDLDTWMVHAQVLDTNNGVEVLKRAAEGKDIWWYVNHQPPRPYGNFLLDFQGIEHRILFWQTWALGINGMHYWDAQYIEPGTDPFTNLLDITPVNGDGLLLYPAKDGVLESIRWEIIRDGVEDFDYLTLFTQARKALQDASPTHALLQRATTVGNLEKLIPNLVNFPRNPQLLEDKRAEIGRLIVEMRAALR
jgi:hypothetical protein